MRRARQLVTSSRLRSPLSLFPSERILEAPFREAQHSYHSSRGWLHYPGIFRADQPQAVNGSQETIPLFLEPSERPHLPAQPHAVLKHHRSSWKRGKGHQPTAWRGHTPGRGRERVSQAGGQAQGAIPSFTFPVVVPVHVEGVEKLVVVVSHQIHGPSMRLDDPNDLPHTEAPMSP